MQEHKQVARRGGSVAKAARVQYETKTGKKAVSPLNAKNLNGFVFGSVRSAKSPYRQTLKFVYGDFCFATHQ